MPLERVPGDPQTALSLLESRAVKRVASRALAVTVLMATSCVSPIALEPALLAYDRTVTRIQTQMMLINVGRAHANLPLHWTEVSSIAATFTFKVDEGVNLELTPAGEVPVGNLNASISASAAESPTIAIIPMQGEEFTKRILTPLDESLLGFLLWQGADVGLILRMIGQGLYVAKDGGPPVFFGNDPEHAEQYTEFRRRVQHLQWLQHSAALQVTRLRPRDEWPVRIEGLAGRDIARVLEPGFHFERKGDSSVIWRRVNGRVVITNYDPRHLSDEDVIELDERARGYPPDFVLVDIRKDAPGGDYGFTGWLKLRSFRAVIDFVARGIDDHYETAVAKDPRTPDPGYDPVRTLELVQLDHAPKDALFTAELLDRTIALRRGPDERAARWNGSGFDTLMQLYHMTTSNVPRLPGPIIAIAK